MMERRFLDLAFQIRGAEAPHPDIVIVEINDTSLRKIGSWPWPRSYHRTLLELLEAHHPGGVFYDMIFSEASEEKADRAFAEEIKKAGNVVLPFYFAAQGVDQFSEKTAVYPIPLLKNSARSLGFVNQLPDRDGHLREILLARPAAEGLFLHTSLCLAALHEKWGPKELADFVFPEGTLINFPGPYGVFPRIPFDELIGNYGSPALQPLLKSLEGKIVLVGFTAVGTGMDLKPTAFSSLYPGIGIQASMLHTILTKKFIRRLPLLWRGISLFLFALLVLTLARNAFPLKSLLDVTVALGLLFGATQFLFQFAGLWVPYFSFFTLGSLLFLGLKLVEFIKVRFEKELFSRELALASNIQKSFLPKELPEIPGLEVAALSLPAGQVGGDLYDVFALDEGHWGFCVGDVSGKGVPAALFMAKAISELRREATAEPQEVLQKLNVKIATEGPGGLFLTLLYLVVDPGNRRFFFASGGHEPLLHYKKNNHDAEFLSCREGIPLGILPEGSFRQEEAVAEQGDLLLLLSDGVKEAMNARRETFGLERIQSVVRESAEKSPGEIIQHLLKRIRGFVKDASQHDDLTLVCAKFV